MQDDAAAVSEFHVEKYRAEAVLTLSSGRTVAGCFFVASGSARHAGRERVGDLLNSEAGFFPFEIRTDGQVETVLFHRAHIVMVVLSEHEARRDPGYSVATPRAVSLLLSSGEPVIGGIRIYRPEGRDRLSDWACHGERFRYVETTEATIIVNLDHVLEAREVCR
jgi:hypothetical protein